LAVFFGGGDLYALPPKGRPIVVGNLYSRLEIENSAGRLPRKFRNILELYSMLLPSLTDTWYFILAGVPSR